MLHPDNKVHGTHDFKQKFVSSVLFGGRLFKTLKHHSRLFFGGVGAHLVVRLTACSYAASHWVQLLPLLGVRKEPLSVRKTSQSECLNPRTDV